MFLFLYIKVARLLDNKLEEANFLLNIYYCIELTSGSVPNKNTKIPFYWNGLRNELRKSTRCVRCDDERRAQHLGIEYSRIEYKCLLCNATTWTAFMIIINEATNCR